MMIIVIIIIFQVGSLTRIDLRPRVHEPRAVSLTVADPFGRGLGVPINMSSTIVL